MTNEERYDMQRDGSYWFKPAAAPALAYGINDVMIDLAEDDTGAAPDILGYIRELLTRVPVDALTSIEIDFLAR